MATSGYRDEYVTKWDTLRFNWSRSDYSVANNWSKVSWNLQLISTAYGALTTSASKAWSVTVNGTSYSGTTTLGIGNNSTKTLASGETTIYHNSDGTKTFSYSFSQVFNLTFSNNYISTISGSSSGTLDTIPRASTLSVTSGRIGDDISITIYPAVNSFTHTISYSFGNLYGNIKTKTTDKSITWTIPDSFYTQIPNAIIGQGGFYCDTYNGNTLVGTTGPYYFTATVDESVCKPTLSPTAVDQGSVSTTLTGDTNKIIKYYNTVNVSFNASANKSATITSMNVTCGSKSRSGDGLLEYVDSGNFIFTVTDSRGYTVSQELTKDTIDYIPLTCSFTASPELGDDTNTKINLAVKGNYFNGSFGAVNNSLTVEYRYKVNDGSYPTDDNGNDSWTQATSTLTDNGYTANIAISNLNYNNTYTVQTRAKDSIYTGGVTATEQVVRIIPVFDWSKTDFNFNVPVFSSGGFTYNIPIKFYGNCNELRTSGEYYIGTSGTNKPGSGLNGWLTVRSYSTDYCYQQYMTYTGLKYERMQQAGAWTNWICISTPRIIKGTEVVNFSGTDCIEWTSLTWLQNAFNNKYGTTEGVSKYELGVIVRNGDDEACSASVLGTYWNLSSTMLCLKLSSVWTGPYRVDYMFIATDN